VIVNVDEIVNGALLNVLTVAGRRAAIAISSRRQRQDADLADFFVARADASVHLPGISPEISTLVNGPECQAALHELLAAQLTASLSPDVSRAHALLRTALSPSGPAAAEILARYYEDEINALIARLESRNRPLLEKFRSQAYSARMIAILNAIERHIAALSGRPDQRIETDFLTRYCRHVLDYHGKLSPPDFDRRRRVPVPDIYVPVGFSDGHSSEAGPGIPLAEVNCVTLEDFAKRLDRTVLLGDPGGGKTTAANVLMYQFASKMAAGERVPFLVTLREYIADRSFVGHIEHKLETFYQCPPPNGLLELLLLNGRAVVIFDGLDELLDTSQRRAMSDRVERFCTEYPLAPVLVTSRLVGYEEAQLDSSQFVTSRLCVFGPDEVAAYAGKWFALDEEARPGDAEAFAAESEAIPDLRSNPLLLSLLCILYRGAGSLPRKRAQIYEQCANLLYRRWDAQRQIQSDLRSGHLLEPTIRHLAWWLFTRKDSNQTVTEYKLISVGAEFLHVRGVESADDAVAIAREFVTFCRGRMWVFTDVGTRSSGERLYSFTHRTFLEYFAAAHLAFDSDSPEELARRLAPRLEMKEWSVVAELALQIKDQTSTDGARRAYTALLGHSAPSTKTSANILWFLATSLRSVDPSAGMVRHLSRKVFTSRATPGTRGVEPLVQNCGEYREIVMSELRDLMCEAAESGESPRLGKHVRLVIDLPEASWGFASPDRDARFWQEQCLELLNEYRPVIVATSYTDAMIRKLALKTGLISVEEALEMPGGLTPLFEDTDSRCSARSPYLASTFRALAAGWPAYGTPPVVRDLSAIGSYLVHHPQLPWFSGPVGDWNNDLGWEAALSDTPEVVGSLDPVAFLGAAAITAILIEQREPTWPGKDPDQANLGPLRDLLPYVARRTLTDPRARLPQLPVSEPFTQTFRDWADGKVKLAE
jgi:hypothetical protein